jgi:hypothetical protein
VPPQVRVDVCLVGTGTQPNAVAARPYVWFESLIQPYGNPYNSPSLLLDEATVLGPVRVRTHHFTQIHCHHASGVDFGDYHPHCVDKYSEEDCKTCCFQVCLFITVVR